MEFVTSIFGLWVFFFTLRILRGRGSRNKKKETDPDRWAPSGFATGAASPTSEMERGPSDFSSARRNTNRGGGATPVTLRGVDLPDL